MKKLFLYCVFCMLMIPFVGCGLSESPELLVSPNEAYCGLFPVSVGDNMGYIDSTGNMVITPQFDGALEFSEGLAVVVIGDRWGYIDKEGKYVINPQFGDAWSFFEGLARVRIGDRWGYLNKRGNIVYMNPHKI